MKVEMTIEYQVENPIRTVLIDIENIMSLEEWTTLKPFQQEVLLRHELQSEKFNSAVHIQKIKYFFDYVEAI